MLIVFSVVVGSALGFQTFQGQIPNGNKVPHPCKANFMWPGVGHQSRLGGGVNNQFGIDFKENGYVWNSDICWADSDGDDRTNGQELGDPYCTWTPGQIPFQTENITHPGICDPYDSTQCTLKNSFVECDLEEFKCPRLENPGVQHINLEFSETTIPPTETNYYCMTFDLPSDQDYHVIATEPIMDNKEVLHHILVYACEGENSTAIKVPQACGMEAQSECGSIIGLWTVGSPGFCYGDNIGYRFGQTVFKRVKLEIHYNNPFEKYGMTDKSGIKLYYQPAQPDVQDTVIVTLGTNMLEIPPGEPRVVVESICKGTCTAAMVTKPAKIFAGLNHMHYLGSEMMIELFRGGKKIADITRDPMYNYDSPFIHSHSPALDLLPGDEIRTTCVYNAMNSPEYVFFGEATKDEMCFGFVFVYPKSAISFPYCLAFGQLDVCDVFTGKPIQTSRGECDWGAFTHFEKSYRPAWTDQVKEKCRMDAACRPHCRSLVEELVNNHPCMTKEASQFVNWRLSESEEGSKALARINGCRGSIMAGGDPAKCGWDECWEHCQDTGGNSGTYDAASCMNSSWVKVVTSVGILLLLSL